MTAVFRVLQPFRTPADAQLKFLEPGGVYMTGDLITGLNQSDAAELLMLAPDGTFEAVDEMARVVQDWAAAKRAGSAQPAPEDALPPNTTRAKMGGSLKASGEVDPRKGG